MPGNTLLLMPYMWHSPLQQDTGLLRLPSGAGERLRVSLQRLRTLNWILILFRPPTYSEERASEKRRFEPRQVLIILAEDEPVQPQVNSFR